MASLSHADIKSVKNVYADAVEHLKGGLKDRVTNKSDLKNVSISDWESVVGTVTNETFEIILSGINNLPVELILQSVDTHPCYIETQFCEKGSVRIFFYWIEPPQPHQAKTLSKKNQRIDSFPPSSRWTPLSLFLLIILVGYFAYTKKIMFGF
jgi:hypothetical protein